MIELLHKAAPIIQGALLMTLLLGLSSAVLGTALGLVLALFRLSPIAPLRWLAFWYVSIFRGTPLLLQLLLIYFGLPHYGIELEPVPTAILALSLCSAAYLSENFRSGILGVDRGQIEAAQSLGMGAARSLFRIILPQAIRIAAPTMGTRYIALMKDTSLASTITVVELTKMAEQIGSNTFRYMEMFIIAGALYWVINQMLTFIQVWVESKLGKGMS
ncbi:MULTISPECIES: amino acid ABC transporter permease [Bordetella]|uniref:ABC transporter permease n=1 Tax=Bordetella genomosp. 6 TaxID=463024 RepID=A0ABX4F6Y7_9BORD|nr:MULTISPECIES: amino acid ABC transporter permease [Bordetella]AOB25331.1 ABC transporter permease [Bordetella bronchiseptica]ARP78441.1 ABC transporter permease [Bordetella genomosp. 6]AZW42582.1 amino acid ABC transporter permease [Bordetella bronchiseptica]KCV64376.1 putative inner membrane amino-acid ABC transporter, permease protein YecS [Bordetella bronchiseptica 99-R-0433]MBN3268001.1 amino acid ABC transporter permease [Bordetella bronchiseptica]